jgi:hypothetical protein
MGLSWTVALETGYPGGYYLVPGWYYVVPDFFRVLWYYGRVLYSTRGYYRPVGYYGYCAVPTGTTVLQGTTGTTVLQTGIVVPKTGYYGYYKPTQHKV